MPVSNLWTGISIALHLSRHHGKVRYRLVTCDTEVEIEDGEIIKFRKDPDPEDGKGKHTDKDPTPDDGDAKQPLKPEDNDSGSDDSFSQGYESHTADNGLIDQPGSARDIPEDSPIPVDTPAAEDGIVKGIQIDADYASEGSQAVTDNTTISMGDPGYGDYYINVEEGSIIHYNNGSWMDFEGNVLFLDEELDVYYDLKGNLYDYTTSNGNVYVTPQEDTYQPSDFIDPDWNTPEDDSWMDDYDYLPTDEDGDLDFTPTFGLDDGE